ncbi:MAG TPA: aminoglycoside phosphotransferase family protein [Hanamia sp.]
MKKFEPFIKKIHSEFPDYIISSIKKTGEGDNSKAFIINEEYIFRFPKSKDAKTQMRKEIAVLPKIKPLLNISIPIFEFISFETNFAGHKIIPGVPLTFKIYNSLHKKNQGLIQQSLANFLSQLHHIDLSKFKDCHLETMDPKEEYWDNFRKAQKLIYPHISKNKRNIITKIFTEYLSNQNNFNYTPALIHNDFSKDHILFDTAKQQIMGIIDFGDMALGDPDYDFMYLLDEFGEEFLKKVFKIYHPKNKKEVMKKLCFFSLTNKLQIILVYKDDKDSIDLENAYKNLEIWFKKFVSKK